MADVLFPGQHTVQEWRDRATQARQRAADSFARSDTDGFLTQGAAEVMAQAYDLCAELVENGGLREFPGVYDLEGNLTDFRLVNTRYGPSWRRETEAGEEWFNPSKAANPVLAAKNNRRKGFVLGRVLQQAVVRSVDDGLLGRYVVSPDYKAEPQPLPTTELV